MSELLDKLEQCTTANVSDALGSLGVMHPAIKAMVPGCKLLGPAFTVKAYPGSIVTVHKALYEAQPGQVIVVDGEGDIVAGALFGEIMARECRAKGFAGIVVDGSVRDLRGLHEQRLPVFARAITPRVGTNRRLGHTQQPVSCGGIVVHPGDLVLGDDDGVIVIPSALQVESRCFPGGELVAALDAVLVKERKLIEGVDAGHYLAHSLNFVDLFSPQESTRR